MSSIFSLCFSISNIVDNGRDAPEALSPTTNHRGSNHPLNSGEAAGVHDIQLSSVSKVGWILHITRSLVPTVERVFCGLADGYLILYDREISKYDIGKKEGVIARMDCTGAVVKTCSTSLGKPFGISIKGSQMSLELDADGLALQGEWVAAIKSEIDGSNANMVINGDYEQNSGVVEWYRIKVKQRDEAKAHVCIGTPMKKHYLQMGSRKDHERIVYVDAAAKCIGWKVHNSSAGAEKSIPMDEITEIREGAKTDVLESLMRFPARAACCFSIIADSRNVDFEAQTVDERNRWVDHLRIIREVARLEAAIEKKKKLRGRIGSRRAAAK